MAKQNTTSSSKSSRTLYFVALAATAIAIGIHFYLTLHHFALKYGAELGDSLCNINSQFSCTAAALSMFSEFLGVPMALWGAVTNAALLVLALLYPITDDESKPRTRNSILTLAGFIALTSVAMAVISLTQLTQLCPFCIATYVLSFISLFGFWKGLPAEKAKPTIAKTTSTLPVKSLAITAVGILILGFIVNTGVKKNYAKDSAGFDAQINAYIQEWQSNPQLTIDAVEPLVKGSTDPNATLTIVEFADFRCGHCKHAAPALDAFVKARPDVRLIFQTYPLDGECNSDIPHSSGASCLLTRAFLCAGRSEKGWEAHDWIFAHQEKMATLETVRAEMATMAKDLGLDAEAFKTCTESDEVRKAVEGQAKLGRTLGLRGTPTVYANNRLLPAGQLLPVLQKAYEAAKSK